jgi:hypothetical protein
MKKTIVSVVLAIAALGFVSAANAQVRFAPGNSAGQLALLGATEEAPHPMHEGHDGWAMHLHPERYGL